MTEGRGCKYKTTRLSDIESISDKVLNKRVGAGIIALSLFDSSRKLWNLNSQTRFLYCTTTNLTVSPLGTVKQHERLKGIYIACKFRRTIKAKVGRRAYSRKNSWMNNPHVLSGVKIGLDLQVIVQDNVRHNGCLQAASYFALFLCSVS